jgi:polyketide cyclase/dehydrase/lipid transport protein
MEDSMRYEFSKTAAGYVLAVACLAGTVSTQTAVPAAQAAPHSSAVASPTYVSLRMEITVNRPAAEVWKQFGKYCSVAEWMQTPCTITSGKDGELGAVRTLGGGEVLVGRTEFSYTYTQPVKEGQPYNLYHGTFEARPVTATTSKLIYEFVFDNSMLPDDAAREADKAQRTATFTQRLERMKVFLDGGTLPPSAR